MDISVAPVSRAEYMACIDEHPEAHHMQLPYWAKVKDLWEPQHLVWRRGNEVLGGGQMLLRPLPHLPGKTRYMAYFPHGPVLSWDSPWIEDCLRSLAAFLHSQSIFSARIGPYVERRRWDNAHLLQAIHDKRVGLVQDITPTKEDALGLKVEEWLRALNWARTPAQIAGQSRFTLQLELPEKIDELWSRLPKNWRQGYMLAVKMSLVTGEGGFRELPDFHALYAADCGRRNIASRPLEYFQTMWRAAEASEQHKLRLHIVRNQNEEPLAAVLIATSGTRAWHCYSGSIKKTPAYLTMMLQWDIYSMLVLDGYRSYEVRQTVTDLEDASLRLLLDGGSDIVEYVGEWDLSLNRLLHWGLTRYLERR